MTKNFWKTFLEYIDSDARNQLYNFMEIEGFCEKCQEKDIFDMARKISENEDDFWVVLRRRYFKNYKNKHNAIQLFSPKNALTGLRFFLSNGYLEEDFMMEQMNKTSVVDVEDRNPLSIDESLKMISLCRVNYPDSYGKVWLERIADFYGNTLHEVSYDETQEPVSSNRRLIYRNDGASEPYTVGFWEWFDYPQQYNEEIKWRSESRCIKGKKSD